jgi:hypothetical protein
MKKTFVLNVGASYSYIAICQSIKNDSEWRKMELRYFWLTDDFQWIEMDQSSGETIRLEKMARKWCNDNNLAL